MNRISLDSVGAAGFSHAFGTLDGQHSDVAENFESFNTLPPHNTLSLIVPLVAPVIPILSRIPTARSKLARQLHDSIARVARSLLERSRSEKAEIRWEAGVSIIGALGMSLRLLGSVRLY